MIQTQRGLDEPEVSAFSFFQTVALTDASELKSSISNYVLLTAAAAWWAAFHVVNFQTN